MTLVMLLISFISDDEMAIIALIICLFALILFQTKTLSTSSYQVPTLAISFLFCCSCPSSSFCQANFWRRCTIGLRSSFTLKLASKWWQSSCLWLFCGDITRKGRVSLGRVSSYTYRRSKLIRLNRQ